MATDWLKGLGHDGRVYVVPDLKLVYVSVAKNACTSLKWTIAELAQEELTRFRPGLRACVTDSGAIHRRELFEHALFPDQVDPALRAEIHPENGWFIFGVIRDPRERLFSAWQQKILMDNPGYRALREEPWFPTALSDASDVADSFARFVDALASSSIPRLANDPHFTSQNRSLRAGKIPYSRIYKINRLGDLQRDLQSHVSAYGWTEPIVFPRSNDTVLRANAEAYPDPVREKAEELYAEDFRVFGEHWDFTRIAEAPAWSDSAIREIQFRAAAGHRLGDVLHLALAQRRRARHNAERARQNAERARHNAERARQNAKRARHNAERAKAFQQRVAELESRLAQYESAESSRIPVDTTV